jgi:hypothetical protein
MTRIQVTLCSLFLLSAFDCIADKVSLRFIGGRPCAQCDITVGEQTMPVNVVIDLGMMSSLLLDKETCSALDVQKDSRATLAFSDSGKLSNLTCLSADLSALQTFTKQYASQLDEIPVVGIVGLPAFDNAAVLLDIQEKVLEYGDVLRVGDDWRAILLTGGIESGYRITLLPAADYKLKAGFTTGSYETWIDSTCASIAGFPGGDFKQCEIGPFNLVNYTAIRPIASIPAGYPDAVIGNSFWQNFQIIVEPTAQTIWLREKPLRISDLTEQELFKALIEEDANAIETYLNAHPASRLAEEAIETLLEQRLAEPVLDKKSIEQAGDRLVQLLSPNAAAEKLIGYADLLFEKQQYDAGVIPYLLKQAKACTMKTTDALLLGYEAEGRLGRYAVLQKDWTQARLHLLSALFGQPNNPQFNYWMGLYYQANGQLTRAWSRYLKASLSDSPVQDAVIALGHLNNEPNFREQFSMQDAQEFLDGFAPTYSPAELPEGFRNPSLTLIETFTSADDQRSALLELAMQALEESSEVIVMNYHLGKPVQDPLETAALRPAVERYGVSQSPAVVVNGRGIDPNQIAWQDPKSVLEGIAAVKSPGNPTRLALKAVPVAGQENSWTLTVPAALPEKADKCEIYLVERRCMLASSSLIWMYRDVVRACLYDQKIESSSGPIVVTLNLGQIQSDIAAYVDTVQNTHGIKFTMIPTYIDAGMSCLVAKIYASDGRLAAVGVQNLRETQEAANAQ